MKITAIVSIYNAFEYIEGCLNDLVDQTVFKQGELEVLVIDSGSTQNEREVVERYQARYHGIRYYRTEERETLYQAWNRGIQLAKGEYLTNANTDDRHHPEALEIQSRVLDARQEVDLVYGDVYESQVPNQSFWENPRLARYAYPTFFAPLSLLYYQFGCQPMWRRTVNSKIGGFSNQLRAAGDWEFAIRFSLAGLRALHIPQILGSFLQRPSSISMQDSTSITEQADIKNRYLNEENILHLYQCEGWRVDSPSAKARAFTDFILRSSQMALPWTPGQTYLEPSATVMGALAAYETLQDDPRIAWNLGVALMRASYFNEAEHFLQRGSSASHSLIKNAFEALSRGETVSLPLVEL